MLVSLNWLQKYFKEPLPAPDEVAEAIIFHSFEVEGGEMRGTDYVMEIKVLPDRAHDCLCHEGIARELGAILERSLEKDRGLPKKMTEDKPERTLKIKIDDDQACCRYVGRVIENISVGPSPRETSELLEAIGQRPINAVVDAANFVMFDLGQPLHAFDADKVSGDIVVRRAQAEEKIITLDNKEVDLDTETLVIADEVGPLAIAGIKGGKRAEVTETTKNLILEAANFDPVVIRKTSARIGLRTDASKRYENEIDAERCERAIERLTDLIVDWTGDQKTVAGSKVDVWPRPGGAKVIDFDPKLIVRRLGFEVPVLTVQDILERLGIGVEMGDDLWHLDIPARRIDLERPENIIEEIGRLYGYDKVQPEPLQTKIEREESLSEKRYRVGAVIRSTLVNLGFSEHYGYSFTDKGEIELANPLASDKDFLRNNLSDELVRILKTNLDQILFDNDGVQLFSFDQVFLKSGEFSRLVLGSAYKTKKLNQSGKDLDVALKELGQNLGVKNLLDFLVDKRDTETGTLYEFDFDTLAEEAGHFSLPDLSRFIFEGRYDRPSLYPWIIRDVAVWVPANILPEKVQNLIKEEAGQLLVEGPVLFDTFEKDDRRSFAFRLVFQSHEKTLADSEVNKVLDAIMSSLEECGWEVRK